MGKLLLPALVLFMVRGPVSPAAAAPGDSVHAVSPPAVELRIKSLDTSFGKEELREPLGLCADPRGYVYVADAMAGKIFRYSPGGESVEFEQPPLDASIYPIDAAVFGSFIYVLDYAQNRVLRYDYRGAYLDILISFTEYERMRPNSLTCGPGGNMVVTDIENHRVTVFSPLLDIDISIGEFGLDAGSLNKPFKTAVLPDEGYVVAEVGNRRAQIFSPAGRYEKTLILPGGREFSVPRSVCADRSGNIFIADTKAGRISVFSLSGDYLFDIDSCREREIAPSSAAIGWDDVLYVADLKSRSILLYKLIYSPK
ncbi:MAG: hypothetical protein JXB45_03010 [Candidatus Krumholzibacteriota bacterium]|nr:hypothetical protein [Candidatus Krumholzibacteriota bacterium]